MSNEPNKLRYSDEELEEFRQLIHLKIAKAEEELAFDRGQITELNENGFNQQGGDSYEDTNIHAELEMMQRRVMRGQQLVSNLQNALLRIRNKSYGICTVTGQLIDKKRLQVVPHATKSVEGKSMESIERTPEPTVSSIGMPEEDVAAKLKKTSKKKPSDYDEDGAPTDDARDYGRRHQDDEG